MGSLIDEEKHLGNGDSSFLTPQLKCKRQKVSTPRKFGPNDGVVYKQTEEKGLQRNDELYVDGVLKEVLTDIRSLGENDGDPQEAERRGLVEQMVLPGCLNGLELKASHLAACGKVRLENEELINLSVENPYDIMANIKDEDKKMKSNSASASNHIKELLENTIAVNGIERGVIVQSLCPQRHLSNIKKRGYDARDNQQRYLTRSKNNAEKLAEKTDSNPKEMERDEFPQPSALRDVEADSEDKVKEPAKLSPSRVGAKVSKRKKHGYEARENQQRYLTRSKYDAEKMAEKTDLTVPNPKEMETDVFSQPLGRDEADSEDKVKKPAELSSSRVSAKVSKRKKRGYDARDNQQCCLTQSKYNSEKLGEKIDLIVPNPKETETNVFSKPSLRDDEVDSEDKVKEPSQLSPSQVSAEVSKRKKHCYDAQDTQRRYLTRSKSSVEKVAEKSVLILPSPKETETDKVSRPLGLRDNEVDSDAKVKEPAQLSPSQVSAKVSKRKKHRSNTQDTQQRYLTRSKFSVEKVAEKSALILPSPKETEADKVSRPLGLRDDEVDSDDKVKEPSQLSPSQVSAEVSKRKKYGYDAQDTTRRYLTRSKSSVEKVAEKSVLILPSTKETETDKVSRPLGLRDDEVDSDDKVKEPAQLNSSQVSANVSKRKKRGYDAQDTQQRYLTRSKSIVEKSVLILPSPKETETDKVSRWSGLRDDEVDSDKVNELAQLIPSPVRKGKKRDYDSRDNQQRYVMRSKYRAEIVEEKSSFKTPNHKEKETDEFSQPIAPGDDEDCCEDEVKRPAKLIPSRVSGSVSKGKKCSYDARENQQRYLTRNKCTAEKMGGKSALIIPNFKETEADEFSQPVALGDEEDDCPDEGKLPAKLSPSRVSANVGKAMKCGYDEREIQQTYLTTSKYTAEKMGEKPALTVPNPKETEGNEFSRPLALGDDKVNCDNYVKQPAILSPSWGSGNVGKGMKCGYDHQEKQQRYLTRNICSVEKVAENSVLIIPDPNGANTIKVSRPLALGDCEDYSEDQVTGSAKVSKGKRCDHDAQDNQQLYLTRSKFNAQKLTEISIPDTKETLTGKISRSLALGDDQDNSKDEMKGPTKLSPSCVRENSSKGKKPGFDALENQQRYLTRSIYSAEKLAEKSFLIIPDPKETETNEVCQPIALGDDGNYSAEHDSEFELNRIPGQYRLARKEVKQSKSCKVWDGRRVKDISKGREKLPIGAVNTVDDEKPPLFTYITSTMYPDWCQPLPPKGCDCKGGCSDSKRCACAVKNGGEIPYNLRGAILEAKPLVYECGPSCKCPPSCPIRVSQRGIKLPLEIFKTKSMGWGVRCRSSIPSGTFICEYTGELLDDKEAEERVGSDEYLFDIGQNSNDTTLSDGSPDIMPDMPSIASKVVNNIGFTIDAAHYGNIGRFVNHSCSPNLYAQNVLYDHEDERIPHVMLFATENIPPLQELTYHYNYTIDQVFDSKGNIKKKSCYCGSDECTGRMY